MSYTVGTILVTAVLVSTCAVINSAEQTNEDKTNTTLRIKRSPISSVGLFPFLRAGRARNFPATWGMLVGDDKNKREGGFISFPRVGRSGPKRNGGGGNGGGLWFGPRLGRNQKRGDSWTLEQLQPNLLPGYPAYNEEEKENQFSEELSDESVSNKIV
uniref:CAP2b/CAPA prepropeptide n=2 Tax=Rhodnius prolixus TaxID=13249 RepID=A7LBC2_RHOPR|nr:CAP2b/CAPA prepropeptide [Rhodnius prolixus]